MDLLILIAVVVLVGFGVYILTTKVPMPPYWAGAIQIVALILILLFLLRRLGVTLPNVM
jgi:uncharacterized membrane protein YkvI